MASSKEIRRRIKSVKNIGQITKAMELVSAAKMRKAQASALASRPYSTMSSELLRNLMKRADLSESLNHFERLARNLVVNTEISPSGRDGSGKILAILITSDRGLAGAFNANVINKALNLVKDQEQEFDFITVGKKGTDALKRTGRNIVATFPAKDRGVTLQDAKPIAQIAMQDYLSFKYEKVFIVYTDYISTLVQKANVMQLLPFVEKGDIDIKDDFIFEPDANYVLENLIKRAIEFAVFQSLVEATASEHSARMVAMRNANDAAGDLLEDLSLSYNQARQAGITRELAEISAAKLAMEG